MTEEEQNEALIEGYGAARDLEHHQQTCDTVMYPLLKIAEAYKQGNLLARDDGVLVDLGVTPPPAYTAPSNDQIVAAVTGLQRARQRAETARGSLPAGVKIDGLTKG